ncbi:hypothetical protein RPC_2985 [Rhodopseudomonas palustris BisB18]|uniref:Uncharacterized protein n=1 Tax=Rhodopseudomonas palustris (strain BisB18) TaxID=316056 RepID=Q213A6_RHOPB
MPGDDRSVGGARRGSGRWPNQTGRPVFALRLARHRWIMAVAATLPPAQRGLAALPKASFTSMPLQMTDRRHNRDLLTASQSLTNVESDLHRAGQPRYCLSG